MTTSVPVLRVVIIGCGFGGLEAARALRNAAVEITLVDRTNHHLFQPLLYQVATAGLSRAGHRARRCATCFAQMQRQPHHAAGRSHAHRRRRAAGAARRRRRRCPTTT